MSCLRVRENRDRLDPRGYRVDRAQVRRLAEQQHRRVGREVGAQKQGEGAELPALYAGTAAFWSAAEMRERSPAEVLADIAMIEPASAPSWRKPAAEPIPHRFTYWPVVTPPDPDHPAGSLALEAA